MMEKTVSGFFLLQARAPIFEDGGFQKKIKGENLEKRIFLKKRNPGRIRCAAQAVDVRPRDNSAIAVGKNSL